MQQLTPITVGEAEATVELMTGRYHGQPMQAHIRLPVAAEHFDRWIALFEATANELCPPQAAAHFIERARRIADSLELGIGSQQGKIVHPRFSTVVRQSARPSSPAADVACG